ncbi:SIR2 family protein [Azospirillum sp. TSO5]|uniref:protein kinase domain-containing protein n=1 Tax=Azospirillum sp. TSO5 TaxID=716760 RepID=UPI001304C10F|nr:SIR2 family protein [Azospirillum sp. TSO5]
MESIRLLKDEEAKRKEDEINEIYGTNNSWHAFDIIKGVIGEPSFKAALRVILERADNAEPPEIYRDIWGLPGVSGLLTLNLDGFAEKAHRRVRPLEDIAVFTGKDASDYVHIVNRRKPFIANLHGIHQSARSWVFTRSDLKNLISDQGYCQFVKYIIADRAIVFLGISADDVAAGGFLQELAEQGIDLGQHFWITDRRDSAANRWANKAGVQIVRYEPNVDSEGKSDHSTVLSDIIKDLREFVSKDQKAPVVIPQIDNLDYLPSQKELLMLDDEDEIRKRLAGYAKSIIEKNGGTTDSLEYRSFLKNYSRAIHQAWHVKNWEPSNIFYGYSVVDQISSGSFSSVWKVVDESGSAFAAKIIQIDNLEKGPQLDSFRRGVQSLRFLSNADVPGNARYVVAHEIPTSIIMDFIEGDNLNEIVKSRNFKFWMDGIKIILSVANHLVHSHNLPQGVLHRDIRPTNIMVPYFYYNESDISRLECSKHDVVLLNYDMSWHLKARGVTITGNIEEAGYYPPEQVADINNEQSRSALVDSYGLGMSLFYACTGCTPPTGGGNAADWSDILKQKIRRDPSVRWQSAHERVRRLILTSTSPEQKNRPTVRQIAAELEQLVDVVEGRWQGISPDFWAEEILYRSVEADYESNSFSTVFTRELRAGRTISIKGDIQGRSVAVSFENVATEATNRSGIDRLWTEKLRSAKDILSSNEWEIKKSTGYSGMTIILEASIETSKIHSNLDRVVRTLKRALDQVRLD